MELPLRADFAFIKGMRADNMGNVEYDSVSINNNMATAPAADVTMTGRPEAAHPLKRFYRRPGFVVLSCFCGNG